MKRIVSLIVVLMMLSLCVVAQEPCPDQIYRPLTGYNIVIDPNRISYDRTEPNDPDYANRKRLLLGVLIVPVNTVASYVSFACDQDGDPLRIKMSDGLLQVLDESGAPAAATPDAKGFYRLLSGGKYRWSFTPAAIGVTYHHLEAWDSRTVLGTNDARKTSATVVIGAIPRNRPPTCGGLP